MNALNSPECRPTLSVVIPTLNAASGIAATLMSLQGEAHDIIVVDGGSSDATVSIAQSLGATVLRSERGRGRQLIAGAHLARGDWLLFLHGDTRLAANWPDHAAAFTADPANTDRAAVFTFALDDESPQARRLESLVMWRTRLLGLPYGDQGLLMSRRLYDLLGGYSPLPLMEDVDLVRRIGRNRLHILPVAAVTSAERWRRDGWMRRSLRNVTCLALYMMGVSPRVIARLYG